MEKEMELSSVLECPVCFSIPEGEIFNCERGHSVCSDCSKKLQRCAFCNSPLTESRNYAVESLVAYFRKYSISFEGKPHESPLIDRCKFEGCKGIVLRSKIDEHAQKCDFRPAPCIMTQQDDCDCRGQKFQLSEYFNHLKFIHDIMGQSNTAYNQTGLFVKVDRSFQGLDITTSWPPYYFEYDRKIFVRHASILNRNIRWWIQLIGPDREAKNYQATVSLQSPHKMLKVAWTIPVHPIRTHRNEVEKSKEFASLATVKLIQFCKLDEPFQDRIATHMWTFNVTLSKIA